MSAPLTVQTAAAGRVLLPTACRILALRDDNFRTRTLTLDLQLHATPGQFVMLWLPRFDEKPFSLVAANPVTVMVTAVGPFTRLVHELQVGDRIWVRGPFGQGFQLPSAVASPVLVGGGYGVAPLFWLAQEAAGRSAAVITTLIGARTAADLLYTDRFEALAATDTRHRLMLATEDGSRGVRGRVTDLLAPLLDAEGDYRPDALYACGPHGMLQALQRLAVRHALPAQLSWEAYMRCAIGICGACEHQGALLCLDGPVLQTLPPPAP
jgi:dihydroorotate dehydrogenase electron transfer subunit